MSYHLHNTLVSRRSVIQGIFVWTRHNRRDMLVWRIQQVTAVMMNSWGAPMDCFLVFCCVVGLHSVVLFCVVVVWVVEVRLLCIVILGVVVVRLVVWLWVLVIVLVVGVLLACVLLVVSIERFVVL